jgi:hypothetical protein
MTHKAQNHRAKPPVLFCVSNFSQSGVDTSFFHGADYGERLDQTQDKEIEATHLINYVVYIEVIRCYNKKMPEAQPEEPSISEQEELAGYILRHTENGAYDGDLLGNLCILVNALETHPRRKVAAVLLGRIAMKQPHDAFVIIPAYLNRLPPQQDWGRIDPMAPYVDLFSDAWQRLCLQKYGRTQACLDYQAGVYHQAPQGSAMRTFAQAEYWRNRDWIAASGNKGTNSTTGSNNKPNKPAAVLVRDRFDDYCMAVAIARRKTEQDYLRELEEKRRREEERLRKEQAEMMHEVVMRQVQMIEAQRLEDREQSHGIEIEM